ncbi:MAG: response regulator transcription factor [Mobiluncus porci]|uniref:Response regulator transcription factor n=1 Tax=Mobiluncus porci TaxID=2652278 RepID=A0A7K0JZQ1_9ACTO|nr:MULTISPECIES: response regulator transcription factor [Mobiluncus]MCI6584576.1 response regulator transcription factor [Mobiluncus sp.]MDD7541586.1 response regulator transcription factor [Mobiluncus porci]MDY5748571.1 response regulator transcription factor [Mobiluncus porci]MST48673.1 response regulator transcription factor [Mobiluncus porci]
MAKIIIVEDQTILLDSLAGAIAAETDFEVVGKLTDAAAIHAAVHRQAPDIVLMDVKTENSNGLVEAAKLRVSHPQLRIVIFTAMPDVAFLEEAEAAGVDSFVYKNVSTTDLLQVLRRALQGARSFPVKSEVEGLEQLGLTAREIDVLRLVCRGLSRKEIAKKLFLSENTVKSNISSLLARTGFTSVARLALWAVSSGFIFVDDADAIDSASL